MKKILITLFLALAMLPVIAQNAWTVEMVPNTRLQSNSIHVSDPDDYLSQEAEMKINTMLCAIRDTADVFLVCLNSIGYEEPADFRSKLFNHWGIGDKTKNNGLLLLFVEDAHAFEFETGYGIEATLPDIKCFEIFNHTIKPYFKEGEYEKGMVAGVNEIFDVFGGTMPATMITDLPDEEVYATVKAEKDKEIMSSFYLWFIAILILGVPIVSFLYFLSTRKNDKKFKANGGDEIKDKLPVTTKDGLKYVDEPDTTWTGSVWQGKGCSRSLTFGLSALVWFFVVYVVMFSAMKGEEEIVIRNWIAGITIFSYFSWICIKQNRRELKMADKVANQSLNPRGVYDKAKNYRRTQWVNILAFWMGWYFIKQYKERKEKCPEMLCPDCREAMTADATAAVIPEKEAAEMAHEARIYTSLRCHSGHVYVLKEKGKNFKKYIDCDKCGARLAKYVKTTVIKRPSYTSSGLDEKEYVCEFCQGKTIKKVVVPKLERSSGGGGSYHSSSGSHSSGGSFGGGRSGGGGYSGRW